MPLIKNLIQRYWALLIMILFGIIAVIGVVSPGWFQDYQAAVWSIAIAIGIVLWSMRKKDKD